MNYRIGMIPAFNIGDEAHGGDQPFRQNDGSLIIMQGAEEDEDTRPVLIVPRVNHVKRSEAYRADDPDQMAFAQFVVDLLNAATE